MLKILSFSARKPGATREDFLAYWHDVHAPMWRDVPGLRGYVTSTVSREIGRAGVPSIDMAPFDGVIEIWYDDLDSMARSVASPGGQAWREDSGVFIGAMRTFLTKEEEIVSSPKGPRPPVKVLTMVKRRPGETSGGFKHRWGRVNARMAKGVPGLRSFVLSHLVEVRSRSDIPALAIDTEIDGFSSAFVASPEAWDGLAASDRGEAWAADAASFLGGVRSWLVEERVHLAPPAL